MQSTISAASFRQIRRLDSSLHSYDCMTDLIIKKLPSDLTSNAGLALVGQYFKRLGIKQRINPEFPISGKGIANSDILKSYLACGECQE